MYRPETDGSAALLKKEMEQAGVDRALTIAAGFDGWDNSYCLGRTAGPENIVATNISAGRATFSSPGRGTFHSCPSTTS